MCNVCEFIGGDFKEWGQFMKEDEDEERSMKKTDNVVFLSAPTGTGKTTFILHSFSDFVVREKKGRILILVPRIILQSQMENILKKFFIGKDDLQKYLSSIRIMTYQALENAIWRGEEIGKFYAVVCDEAHYFVQDILFNPNAQASFDWLCNFISNKQGLVICQSATLDLFQETLVKKLKLKPVKAELDSNKQRCGKLRAGFVRAGEYLGAYYEYRMERELSDEKIAVQYLVNREEMENILIRAEGKRLCFVSNKKHGEELEKSLRSNGTNVLFVSAENKETDGMEAVSSLVCDSTFPSDVLIATSVLDVGVNILDAKVSTVILDTYDQTTFIQMLGRIRLVKEQKVTVYIFRRDVRYFKNWRDTLMPRIQFLFDMFHIPEEYWAINIIRKLQSNKYVDACAFHEYEGRLRFNSLLQRKLGSQLVEFDEIIAGLEEDSEYFIKKQLSWLGLDETFSAQNYASVANRKQRRNELIVAIQKKCKLSCKESLTKEEISETLQNIKEDVRGLDKQYLRSNEKLSVEKFRFICQNEHLPFYVVQREAERKQVYWLIDLSKE